jgi:hypothetical protein
MPPSLASQLAQREESLSKRESRGDFFKLCRMLLKHGNAFNARPYAEAERARPRVQDILQKAAIAPGDLTSWSAIADYENISTAFLESLRSLSVFDAALADGTVKAPLRSRGFSITTGIAGSVVPEVSVKPISSLVITTQLLEPKKAVATIVLTKELAELSESQQLFANELSRGVIAATDSNFLAALVAATTPVASGGSTLALILTDLEILMSNVTTSAASRLYFVTSATNMKGIVAKASTAGAPAFPNLGPLGGELWPGVTAIVSDSISSTAALMFDATAIVGNSEGIIPSRSEQSALQMESASPDSPPVAATTLLPLWQNDLLALRMERFFGYTIMRSNGVASLSGVNY